MSESVIERPHVHEWHPGPLVPGRNVAYTGDVGRGATVILACRCGALIRRAIPQVDDMPVYLTGPRP